MRNLPCQIGNWMGNIVIRHSKNWNLGDGSVTALHTPSSLINSSQISVPIQLKKGEKIVKLLNLAFQIRQNPQEEKGKIRQITEPTITLCDLTSFFKRTKKFLHITGETTPAGNLFAGSADLTQGLSV